VAVPGPKVPTVLVVEDEDESRTAAVTILKDAGCVTKEARSGQEALEILHREGADLILMDSTLPGLDGFDVTRILKARAELAEIPVVLTAQRLDRSKYAFGIQSGATDLLNRPYPPQALLGLVWKVLAHRGFAPKDGLPPPYPPTESSPFIPSFRERSGLAN
jgi:CheY-like chemotaxis protein